jgi:hypothetical protein
MIRFRKYQDTTIRFDNSDRAANAEFQKSGPSDKLLTLQREITTIQTDYATAWKEEGLYSGLSRMLCLTP